MSSHKVSFPVFYTFFWIVEVVCETNKKILNFKGNSGEKIKLFSSFHVVSDVTKNHYINI